MHLRTLALLTALLLSACDAPLLPDGGSAEDDAGVVSLDTAPIEDTAPVDDVPDAPADAPALLDAPLDASPIPDAGGDAGRLDAGVTCAPRAYCPGGGTARQPCVGTWDDDLDASDVADRVAVGGAIYVVGSTFGAFSSSGVSLPREDAFVMRLF